MKKIIAAIAFVIAMAFTANAQLSVKGVARLTYGSADPGTLIHDLEGVYQDPAVDFIRNCNFGLGMRVEMPLGIYAEVGANFSLNAMWDSVSNISENFIEKFGNTFRYAQSMTLSVPVYVGWKFFDVEAFAARVFAGPEFYTTVLDATADKTIDFNTFSLSAGVGIDLLQSVIIDAKVTYLNLTADELANTTAVDKTRLFYSAGIGLLF